MPYENPYSGGGSRTSSWDDYQYQRQHNRTGTTGQDIGVGLLRGLVGGPVGWGELANGASRGKPTEGANDLLGMHFGNGTTLNDNMTEDVYNSMSEDEWNNFAHMSQAEQTDFIARRSAEVAKTKAGIDKADAAQKKLDDEKNARDQQQKDIISKVQKFADEMNMPVDELMQKDGFAQALNKVTYQDAMGKSLNTGAGEGGLSVANADQATKNALLGYQMQRQQMGQQAYNQAYGMINNMGLQAEDLARYNQGMDLQMQALRAQAYNQQYQQGLGKSGQVTGMLGGLVGAYFGGAAGGAAGSQIGSGIGQQSYQSSNPYKVPQYTYPSSTRSNTGGFGGNY